MWNIKNLLCWVKAGTRREEKELLLNDTGAGHFCACQKAAPVFFRAGAGRAGGAGKKNPEPPPQTQTEAPGMLRAW